MEPLSEAPSYFGGTISTRKYCAITHRDPSKTIDEATIRAQVRAKEFEAYKRTPKYAADKLLGRVKSPPKKRQPNKQDSNAVSNQPGARGPAGKGRYNAGPRGAAGPQPKHQKQAGPPAVQKPRPSRNYDLYDDDPQQSGHEAYLKRMEKYMKGSQKPKSQKRKPLPLPPIPKRDPRAGPPKPKASSSMHGKGPNPRNPQQGQSSGAARSYNQDPRAGGSKRPVQGAGQAGVGRKQSQKLPTRKFESSPKRPGNLGVSSQPTSRFYLDKQAMNELARFNKQGSLDDIYSDDQDSFIDDGEDAVEDWRKELNAITNYSKKRFRDDYDDDRGMEVRSFGLCQDEEQRTAKIGKIEDQREELQEAERRKKKGKMY